MNTRRFPAPPPREERVVGAIYRNVDGSELESRLKRPSAAYEKDARYIAEHYEELKAQHPDRWVAILDCNVVAHAPTPDELEEKLRKRGIERGMAVREFLSTRPRNWKF